MEHRKELIKQASVRSGSDRRQASVIAPDDKIAYCRRETSRNRPDIRRQGRRDRRGVSGPRPARMAWLREFAP